MTRKPPRSPAAPDAERHADTAPDRDGLVLQLREAQLRGILDSASEGILTVDSSQTIVMANHAAAELFRCSVAELVGTPLARLVPGSQRARHAQALADFGAAEAPPRRMGRRGEVWALRANGEAFPIEAGISQAHVDGLRLYTVILRDLSEEHRTQEALRRCERLLNATFSVSNVGIVHVDSTTRCLLAVNAAFCRISGYREDELIGRTFEHLIHPEEPFDPAVFARLLRGEGDGRIERRLVRRDGTAVWIELSGSLVPDGAGRPTRVVGVVQDISVRRWTEETLRAREARLAFMVRLNDHPRALDEPAAIILEASRLLGEFIGADRVGYAEDSGDSETIDVVRHYTRGVPAIEGHYRYDDYGPALLSAFRAGRTVVRRDIAGDPALSPDEKAAHAALQLGATIGVPLLKGGTLRAVFFVHQRSARAWTTDEVALAESVAERIRADIERARAEAASHASAARLAAALASMNDGVAIYDPSGHLVDFNDAMVGFYRLRGRSDYPTQLARWPEIIDVRFADGTPAMLDQWPMSRALRGESGSSAEFMLQRRDTGERWLASYSYAPIRDADRRLIGAVITARDVTEFRHMHDELGHAHAELQQLIAAQDRVQEQERLRIARELHDDLQQRLAAIGMEAASVQRAAGQADPSIAETLARIERIALETITSARRIIHDLRPEALEELGLVEALARLVARFGERTGIQAQLDTEGLTEADAGRLAPLGTCLYRVTQEALTNVGRHARAGTVQITLASLPGDRLRLAITDDGIGMLAQRAGGRGRFGLLGMRERVRAAGGTLQVRGARGRGTVVEAELPLAGPPPAQPDL